jgi:predicted nucleic acid-binding protein
MIYYVDTCIWLNLFKKEGDSTKGTPFWKIADEFVGKVMVSGSEIVYTDIVLRELEIVLPVQEFKDSFSYLKNKPFRHILVLNEDRNNARKLESKYDFTISFYDLVHLCIARRIGGILVTRDKGLLRVARKDLVRAIKPEYYL